MVRTNHLKNRLPQGTTIADPYEDLNIIKNTALLVALFSDLLFAQSCVSSKLKSMLNACNEMNKRTVQCTEWNTVFMLQSFYSTYLSCV